MEVTGAKTKQPCDVLSKKTSHFLQHLNLITLNTVKQLNTKNS